MAGAAPRVGTGSAKSGASGAAGPPPVAQEVVRGDDAQVEGGPGRLEARQGWRTEALEGLGAWERGPGLTTVGLGDSTRQGAAHARLDRRDDSSSLPGTTDDEAQRGRGVRRTPGESEHRGHGVREVAMGEETNRTRAGERAQTLACIRTLALPRLRRETSVPVGIAATQKRAGWDHNSLRKILAHT